MRSLKRQLFAGQRSSPYVEFPAGGMYGTTICGERALTLRDKLISLLGKQKTDVFLRADFAALGSAAQLSRALRGLVDAGMVVKLGVGVYAKAKPSVLSGKPIPMHPVEVLAPQVLERLGVKTYPSRLVAAYNAGSGTQLPANVVINIGCRRITRRLGFGRQFIQYETDFENVN